MRRAALTVATALALSQGLFAQAIPQPGGPVQRPPEQPRSGGTGFGGVGLSISLGGKKKAAPEAPVTGPPIDMRDLSIPDFVPGQVLFFLESRPADAAQIARSARVVVVTAAPLDALGVTMIVARIAPGDSVEAAVTRLARNPAVAWAQPDHQFQVLGNSRDRGAGLSGLKLGGKHRVTGSIVLIDSPVDLANPALRGAHIVQEGFGGASTPAAHGTAIAELLVGTGPYAGVAQGARLTSLAAFAPAGETAWLSRTSALILAVNRALALRPDVVNMSFGARRDDPALALGLTRFEAAGTCVVAAAGNGGGGAVLYPGRDPRVVAVTAVDGARRAYAHASRGAEIDVAAWGVAMNAAVPGGRRAVSGTSFATAVVAGALLRNRHCTTDKNPEAMRRSIAAQARDLGAKGHDDIFGAGLFQVR